MDLNPGQEGSGLLAALFGSLLFSLEGQIQALKDVRQCKLKLGPGASGPLDDLTKID